MSRHATCWREGCGVTMNIYSNHIPIQQKDMSIIHPSLLCLFHELTRTDTNSNHVHLYYISRIRAEVLPITKLEESTKSCAQVL